MQIIDRTTQKFYFTYGTDKCFPYYGGWTIVIASNKRKAIEAFRLYHPDIHDGIINCSSIYSESDFKKTSMYKDGNCGANTHEIIQLTRACLS